MYEVYLSRLIEVLIEARGLTAAKARPTAVLVGAIQNGLWLDYSRHRDDKALEHGLRLCEQVAEGHA